MEDKVRAIAERTWADMAGLPWKDKVWSNNQELQDQTKQHYVQAITTDIMAVFNEDNEEEE